jgi:3-oxoacyl-[acyl-carrier protein] reductase
MSIERKVAIVTGAAQGIGRGIALALAKADYHVVVSDLTEEVLPKVVAEIAVNGPEAMAVKCDVSQEPEVKNLFSQTKDKFGRVDVLVNNAGIYPYVPFAEMKEADWDKVMDVNLKSVFLTSREAAKVLPVGGRIINISSIASVVGFVDLSHYCASKGAMNSFARALALELAPQGITVNNIAPGAIETPGASQGMTEEVRQQTTNIIPLARFGKPEDIAGPVVFLASDDSSYITGQTIIVDGGWTLR